jgi:cytidine deaminase
MTNDLIKMAIEARSHAYSPYSNIKVGASLLTKSGRIFTGCNIENSSFGLTICAERVAIFKALSEGETEFTAMAIAADDFLAPCGACRQVIWEFSKELKIILVNKRGETRETSIKELLPQAFELQVERRNEG